ncbi:MAG: hypothetical protein ACR2QC_02795, partial [Gammaproteobacteria bacterium]
MKKINLVVCRAFRAVVRALCNVLTPTLNFKGGGGQEYKNAPYGVVRRRFFLSFAGVLFAAAIPANAAPLTGFCEPDGFNVHNSGNLCSIGEAISVENPPSHSGDAPMIIAGA